MNCRHCGRPEDDLEHNSFTRMAGHKYEPASPVAPELCGVCAHPKHSGKCSATLTHDVGTLCPCAMAVAQPCAGGELLEAWRWLQNQIAGILAGHSVKNFDETMAAMDLAVRKTLVPSSPSGQAVIAEIIRDVAELPDRNSPSCWPEVMLVTGDELRIILERHLSAASPTAGAEPPKCPTCGDEIGEGGATLEEIKNWKRPAGAEPPQMTQVSAGIFTSKFCACPNQANEDGAHCPICGKLKPEPAAAAPLYSEQELKDLGLKATTTNYGKEGSATMYSPVEPVAAEPPPQGYCPSEHPSLKVGCILRPGHEGKHENMGDTWVAGEPKAWPSDLPANGIGAMNLITNFWTGDLKGLTKEGARIVDSLVAHVTKGLRTDVSRLETLVGQLEKIILKKDSDAAGLREQLEKVKRPAQESAAG